MPAGIFWQSFHGLTNLWSVLQSGLGLALAVWWSGFKILPHLIITMADHAKPTGFYFKLTYAVKKCEWCWDWRNYGRFSPIFLCRIRYLQKNGDPKKKNTTKNCDFSSHSNHSKIVSKAMLMEYVLFHVLFSHEMAWPMSLFVGFCNCCFLQWHWAFCSVLSFNSYY